ncbi:MAG: DUF6242 domain-containing protein [Candidatus Symbiothrix sp.]|jgi:hypothetical protein|nr:DUF6242 domain-containing protein [Candidatus Symbiothrix sp.]
MVHLKTGFYILLSSLLLTGLASCLGGSDEDEYIVSTDAQITSLFLSHDSVSILAKTLFSIDQTTGEIYNHDSLPYLTDTLRHLKQEINKVKITFTSGSGMSNLLTLVNGDSVWVKTTDSLDISKALQGGLQFSVFAPSDINIKKEYTLKINIHQVDPDSVQYAKVTSADFLSSGNNKTVKFKEAYYTFVNDAGTISSYKSTDMEQWEPDNNLNGLPNTLVINGIQTSKEALFAFTSTGELYVSTDASSWNKINTNTENEDVVVAILGYLEEPSAAQKAGLSLVVNNKDGINLFAFFPDILSITNEVKTLNYGEQTPADFPNTTFSVINNRALVLNKITLVGNLQNVWATENGLYWVKLSNTQNPLPAIKGGNAFLYNNEIWFLGGLLENEDYNNEIYYSMDGGLVWKARGEKTHAPEDYILRYDASVVVDTDGKYFYIAGGRNQSPLTDIWKGVLNSHTFKE